MRGLQNLFSRSMEKPSAEGMPNIVTDTQLGLWEHIPLRLLMPVLNQNQLPATF